MYDIGDVFSTVDALFPTLGLLLEGGVVPMISVAIYVFTALSMHTIAKKRGISCPWLAWIPVANLWVLGSVSDQYRYLTRGQRKCKRMWLPALHVGSVVLTFVVLAVFVAMIVAQSFEGAMTALLLLIPLCVTGLAGAIMQFMALYDVYASCDPDNASLYLVLSVFFTFLRPIFLFLSREKELGMPPRKQQTEAPYGEQPFEN